LLPLLPPPPLLLLLSMQVVSRLFCSHLLLRQLSQRL